MKICNHWFRWAFSSLSFYIQCLFDKGEVNRESFVDSFRKGIQVKLTIFGYYFLGSKNKTFWEEQNWCFDFWRINLLLILGIFFSYPYGFYSKYRYGYIMTCRVVNLLYLGSCIFFLKKQFYWVSILLIISVLLSVLWNQQ